MFQVDTKNYHHDLEDAAAVALVRLRRLGQLGRGDRAHRVRLGHVHRHRPPGLGEDSRRRFRGCLEDASVDRISGHVLAMTTYTDRFGRVLDDR